MSLPILYGLNLGSSAPSGPTPTGTGVYGPSLLYGLNLASASSAVAYGSPLSLITAVVRRRRGPAPIPDPDEEVVTGLRDWDVMADIRDRLIATGAFDGVHLSSGPEEWGRGTAEGKMAVCQLVGFEDVDEWGDVSDVSTPRKVEWSLTIYNRSADPEVRDRESDRLANVAHTALDGKSLAGLTFPALTKLHGGGWATASAPERKMTIRGTFVYEVIGYGGHDLTD